jgi:hypothetical protein
MLWGVDAQVIERFAQAGVAKETISMEKRTYMFEFADQSPAEMIDLFRRYYGPTMNAFDAAEKNGKADELRDQLVELARSHNLDTAGGTLIPATFLLVTVTL